MKNKKARLFKFKTWKMIQDGTWIPRHTDSDHVSLLDSSGKKRFGLVQGVSDRYIRGIYIQNDLKEKVWVVRNETIFIKKRQLEKVNIPVPKGLN